MERTYQTVTEINKLLKDKIDRDPAFQSVFIKAEISNFKRHSRGHLYFTLKDESSQISAVMFYQNASTLRFAPKEGSKVIVAGYLSLYVTSGTYQIYVQSMQEDGIGDLYVEYEKLKKKLELEGLFRAEYKKPLPLFPRVVGVITSPTGAAVRDIIHVIERRYPLTKVLIYPALVQGEGSKNSLITQINKANQDRYADVLIVGRGGGSIEDLWSFNEEEVAKAIFQSRIPIVSAVGHETDFTIADFVSDLRAPTPSAAAEVVVPDQNALQSELQTFIKRSKYAYTSKLNYERKQLEQITKSYLIRDPKRLLIQKDMMFSALSERLLKLHPQKQLADYQTKVNELIETSHRNILERMKYLSLNYQHTIEKLELVNPLSIMKKGFSVISKQNQIIQTIDQVHSDDELTIQMSQGEFDCKVLSVRKGDS